MRRAEERIVLGTHSPSLARRFVAETLTQWELVDIVDDAVLCTSEVVSNVVQHGAEPASIAVSWTPPVVQIEILDSSPNEPKIGTIADPTAPSGRGLAIVNSIAAAWGITPTTPVGKVVWFSFRTER